MAPFLFRVKIPPSNEKGQKGMAMKIDREHCNSLVIKFTDGEELEYDWIEWSAYEIVDNKLIVYNRGGEIDGIYTMNNVVYVRLD